MKLLKTSYVCIAILTFTACHTLKRNTQPVAAKAETKAFPITPAPRVKPANGVYEPGAEEHTAIQLTNKDVTSATLAAGYKVYTGQCTNCHGTKSIYNFTEQAWPWIIEEMAPGAKITPAQQDAVLKYVLAIKATQPK